MVSINNHHQGQVLAGYGPDPVLAYGNGNSAWPRPRHARAKADVAQTNSGTDLSYMRVSTQP
jgi:hypothetical protein